MRWIAKLKDSQKVGNNTNNTERKENVCLHFLSLASCDEYANRIPNPKHTPKCTEAKVPHTQDKHTQLSSFAELHCHCHYPIKSLSASQSMLPHTHYRMATCAFKNSTLATGRGWNSKAGFALKASSGKTERAKEDRKKREEDWMTQSLRVAALLGCLSHYEMDWLVHVYKWNDSLRGGDRTTGGGWKQQSCFEDKMWRRKKKTRKKDVFTILENSGLVTCSVVLWDGLIGTCNTGGRTHKKEGQQIKHVLRKERHI